MKITDSRAKPFQIGLSGLLAAVTIASLFSYVASRHFTPHWWEDSTENTTLYVASKLKSAKVVELSEYGSDRVVIIDSERSKELSHVFRITGPRTRHLAACGSFVSVRIISSSSIIEFDVGCGDIIFREHGRWMARAKLSTEFVSDLRSLLSDTPQSDTVKRQHQKHR